MNEATLIRLAAASRRLGMPALVRAISPADHFRVTLTHFVFDRDVANFERIVERALADRSPMTPDDVVAACGDDHVRISGRRVAFSFDDGLRSSFEAAQRVLNPLGVRAMFFVPTGIFDLASEDEMREYCARRIYRGDASLAPEQYLTMTTDHVRELHSQGHMVLPHTRSHVSLEDVTSPGVVERELREPKAFLEDLLGAPARGFAFPVGTERVVSGAAYRAVGANYDFCFTGLSGVNSSRTHTLFLHRDPLHAHYPLDHVANVLDGAFDPYYAVKMRVLRERAGGRAVV